MPSALEHSSCRIRSVLPLLDLAAHTCWWSLYQAYQSRAITTASTPSMKVARQNAMLSMDVTHVNLDVSYARLECRP